MRPAGAIGFIPPSGLLGKIIAWRQGVPFSHTVIALGNGKVLDSTVPWTRITDEAYWDRPGVEWYAPTRPFGVERIRQLKSLAYLLRGRVHYSIWALLLFVLRGVPGRRGHGLFCSYLVAECYLTVRDDDLSENEQPWNVDVRGLLAAVRRSGFRKMDNQ